MSSADGTRASRPPDFQVDEETYRWMVTIRRHIHRHPELSYEEHRTAAYIQEKLSELSIPARGGMAGTGVIADIGTGESARCVALRADMDALPINEQTGLAFASQYPGIMHACGHDGHVAMLLGAAALLARVPRLPGGVRLVFQPAEERGNGAAELVREGVLEGVEAIFAGHLDSHFPTGRITVDEGLICAYADPFQIVIRGRGGHAARPHEGTDALVAGASLVMIIQTLVSREVDPNKAEVVTIGSFQAGAVHNVIAGEALLKGTVRSTDEATRMKTIGGLHRIVESIATMYGVRADIHFDDGLPAVINHPLATEIARAAAWDTTSVENVISQGFPSLGAEDFAFYQRQVPGCLVRIGTTAPPHGGASHSSMFDFDEASLTIGSRWLALAAWRWLEQAGSSPVSVNDVVDE